MPELPEVEVVRRGLADHITGRVVASVEVLYPRAVRRHLAGPADFAARLVGRRLLAPNRRGKYLWLPAADAADSDSTAGEALVVHLGMSGQLLLRPAEAPREPHLRVVLAFADQGPQLRFADQRTFGNLAIEPLVAGEADLLLPRSIAHIAPDPFDPSFNDAAFYRALHRRRTGIKRALLDQTLVSGIGNIYADEALWRARLHYARPTETLTRAEVARILARAREVLRSALDDGGTSFDSMYVDVNGDSGYFGRRLAVYGRAGESCPRCGAPIRRDPFMNRSSYTCPHCQPKPRRGRW